jgi:outer membrane protein OmpA-like peptidoglycan-associated protein
MSGLMETLEGMVSPQLLEQVGSKFGIGTSALKTGVGGITSSLLGGLASKSNDPGTMGKLTELVNQSPDETFDATRMIDDEQSPMRQRGSQLLGLATDETQRQGLLAKISKMGLSSSSAIGLLGTCSSFLMAGLRKFGRGRGLTASTMGSMLRSETASLTRPAVAAEAPREYGRAVTRTATPAPRSRSWVPLVLIPLGALLIWFFVRGRHHEAPVAEAPPPAPSAAARRPEAMPPPRTTSPGMTFPANSAEGELLANLRAATASDASIKLDQVKFDPGSSTLEPAAMNQIAHVAQVLKAFPNAHIKIGGYSDATTDAQANMTLSRERAEGVGHALENAGIDSSRLDTESQPAEPAGPGESETSRQVTIQVTAR